MITDSWKVATRRPGQIGNAMSLLDASSRAGVPISEIKRLAAAGLIFELGGRISEAALPIIRERAADLRRRPLAIMAGGAS